MNKSYLVKEQKINFKVKVLQELKFEDKGDYDTERVTWLRQRR